MKTSIAAFGLLLVACTAPVSGGPEQQPTENTDPSSFLQPGGNSYSAPASGKVVVIESVSSFAMWGTRSSTGMCSVDQSSVPHGRAEITFEDDGSILEWPYDEQHPVGTWKQTSLSDDVCMFGECQTCTVKNDPSSTNCIVQCPHVAIVETYEFSDLIPFTFDCTNGKCTTLGGANVNADGTVTYNDFVLATWQGTHVEAQICFGNSCSLFHPTP